MRSKSKKGRMERRFGAFMRLYQRKAQRGIEPNDRRYDHKLEQQIKRLRPEELSDLLSGDAADE
jgi:hypothetical protein